MAAPAPIYYIAGPADDEDFAKAEHLAEMLMSALPGQTCRIIPVLPENWEQYQEKLCSKLGYEREDIFVDIRLRGPPCGGGS